MIREHLHAHIDAVGTEGCKAAVETVAAPPANGFPATASNVCRHCDVCGRPTTDLILACPDCREKAVHFNDTLAEEPLYHEYQPIVQALDRYPLVLRSLLLGNPERPAHEIVNDWLERNRGRAG